MHLKSFMSFVSSPTSYAETWPYTIAYFAAMWSSNSRTVKFSHALFFIDLVNEKPTDSHIKILNNLRDPITILHKMQPYVHKEDPYENIH